MSKHKTIPVYFFGLNNRTPDGHDVSWIWDIYFKNPAFFTGKKIYVFGDRSYDMAVRLTVADIALTHVFTSETEVRQFVRREDKLHAVILTNYSAMLAVRSWITGRSIG